MVMFLSGLFCIITFDTLLVSLEKRTHIRWNRINRGSEREKGVD
jgi:hypothetical protein